MLILQPPSHPAPERLPAAPSLHPQQLALPCLLLCKPPLSASARPAARRLLPSLPDLLLVPLLPLLLLLLPLLQARPHARVRRQLVQQRHLQPPHRTVPHQAQQPNRQPLALGPAVQWQLVPEQARVKDSLCEEVKGPMRVLIQGVPCSVPCLTESAWKASCRPDCCCTTWQFHMTYARLSSSKAARLATVATWHAFRLRQGRQERVPGPAKPCVAPARVMQRRGYCMLVDRRLYTMA